MQREGQQRRNDRQNRGQRGAEESLDVIEEADRQQKNAAQDHENHWDFPRERVGDSGFRIHKNENWLKPIPLGHFRAGAGRRGAADSLPPPLWDSALPLRTRRTSCTLVSPFSTRANASSCR